MLTRRQFLATSSAIGAAYSLPLQADNTFKLSSLHDDIIKQVNRIKPQQDLSLSLLYPQGCLANIEPVIKQFSSATGIQFTLTETGVDDINSAMIINSADDNQANPGSARYDIALPATFGLHDLVNAKALQPLSQYANRYEPSGYKQAQLYDYGDYVDGDFYGYQTDGDTYLMFYNQSMLDSPENQQAFAKQYQYPLAIPETWSQLDDMIRFFHRPEDKQYGGCLFRAPGYGAWEWWSRFHAKGFYPLNNAGEPQINNAAGITALQDMLHISPFLHPNTASDTLFDNWATFASGESFCNIGWGGSQKYFNSDKSAVKDKLYYSPTPGGQFKDKIIACPIFNWGWNYVVSSTCAHPEIAYLFTLFACSPSMSTLAVQKDGYFDPFREEHYANAEIQAIYSKAFLQAHKTSMKNSIPDFYLANQSAYLAALQENIYLAYTGALNAKQALDITASEWKKLHKKIGVMRQQKKWQELKTKYPQALQAQLQ